jgi:hypothetical protein
MKVAVVVVVAAAVAVIIIIIIIIINGSNSVMGHAVAELVEALCYKPESRGFKSR